MVKVDQSLRNGLALQLVRLEDGTIGETLDNIGNLPAKVVSYIMSVGSNNLYGGLEDHGSSLSCMLTFMP